MKPQTLKIIIFILILALYGSVLFYKIDFLTLSVNDLGRHIKNGEMLFETKDVLKTNFYSYTEPDFTFINHHWLSGVIFYFLNKTIGFSGMVIFKMVVLLSAFILVFLASIKKANFWLAAIFSLPAILILMERVELRPEIFSYLFVAVFLYSLIDLEKHPERKRIFWLIPLQLLWVNLHTFFFIGILLTAGFLLEKAVSNLKNLNSDPLVKKTALLLMILIAVCFINPSGIKGALYPLNIFENYGYRISENQSLSFSREIYWWDISIKIFAPLVYLLTFSFLFALKRKPIFYFLASAGVSAASFFLVRALPLFGLIFLPVVSYNFNVISSKIKENILRIVALGTFIFTAIILYQPAATTATPYERGIGLSRYTNDAAIFFEEQSLKGPIFNDYDIGSYLIFHLFPEEKVFVDNRPEAYPASFFEEVYYPAIQQEEKWQEIQEKYDFNVIFFSQHDGGAGVTEFLIRRLDDPFWSLVYVDACSIIFLKNNPENQQVIEKFRITPENISEKMNPLLESDKLMESVTAVNLFILMGREDLIMPAFQKIVTKWPEYSEGWLVMGKMELMMDESSSTSTIAFIKRAVDLGEKTSESYTLLGVVYARAGQFRDAEKAFQNALKINPNRQDAKEYLMQVQKYLK